MILQVAKTLRGRIKDLNVSVHNQALNFESKETLENHSVFNKTTVLCRLLQFEYLQAGRSSLYSRCEDCGMDYCPFEDLVNEWSMHEFSNKPNAYLILCQGFGLSSDVIKIIEDNHESNGIRLDDVLHRICHKNPNITREEIIEIISNGKA